MAAGMRRNVLRGLSLCCFLSVTLAFPRFKRQIPGMGQPFQYQPQPGMGMGSPYGMGPRMVGMGAEIEPTQAPDIEMAENGMMGMAAMGGMQRGMFPPMSAMNRNLQMNSFANARMGGFPPNMFSQTGMMGMMNPGAEFEPTQAPDIEMGEQPMFRGGPFGRNPPNTFNRAANARRFQNVPNGAGGPRANPGAIPPTRSPQVAPPVPAPRLNTLPRLPPQRVNQPRANNQALPSSRLPPQRQPQVPPSPMTPVAGTQRIPPSQPRARMGEVEARQAPEVEAAETAPAANAGNVIVQSKPFQPRAMAGPGPQGAPALGSNPSTQPQWRGRLF